MILFSVLKFYQLAKTTLFLLLSFIGSDARCREFKNTYRMTKSCVTDSTTIEQQNVKSTVLQTHHPESHQ